MRPKGWVSYEGHSIKYGGWTPPDEATRRACVGIYEAGADALLEGLKREALQEYGISKPRADMPAMLTIAVPDKRGYLVFIPDDTP